MLVQYVVRTAEHGVEWQIRKIVVVEKDDLCGSISREILQTNRYIVGWSYIISFFPGETLVKQCECL